MAVRIAGRTGKSHFDAVRVRREQLQGAAAGLDNRTQTLNNCFGTRLIAALTEVVQIKQQPHFRIIGGPPLQARRLEQLVQTAQTVPMHRIDALQKLKDELPHCNIRMFFESLHQFVEALRRRRDMRRERVTTWREVTHPKARSGLGLWVVESGQDGSDRARRCGRGPGTSSLGHTRSARVG